MKLDETNATKSAINNVLDAINSVLNKYAPLKKKLISISLDKRKPWITSGIQKMMYIEKKLLKKFINKKTPQIKTVFHEQYKT